MVALESADGKAVFAGMTVKKISGDWKKYEITLTTGKVPATKANNFVISTMKPGTFFYRHETVWFQQVSLFPPTFDHQPNGFRPDIMKLLAAMHPKFVP